MFASTSNPVANAVPSRFGGAAATGRALFETAAALLPMRWTPANFPILASDVDREFLSAALGISERDGVLTRIAHAGGTSGTTDRVRLALTWDGGGADLPKHVFIKSTPLTGKNRTMVAALAMARNEVLFYQRARSELSASAAPKCFAAHAGIGARHILVLEDLADRGSTPHALSDDVDADYAKAMMVTLGQLHAAFWESPRLHGDLAFVKPERSRPGFSLLLRQFRTVRSKLLRSEEYEFPQEVRSMAAFVNANDWALHANWELGPQTVIHGDTHLGNTYGQPDGTVGLLDWQVIYRAPGMRDVAYFLTHSVPTDVRRAHADEFLQIYLDTLAAGGVTDVMTLPDAWDAVRLFAFDAWDSSAICVLWPGLQAPENVQASMERANAAIVDFDVMPVLRRSV
jgi:hypothetical protein